MAVGKNIKKRREFLGLSQEKLAEKLGYKSRSTINKIEMEINDISASKLEEFSKILETTPSNLMGWKDDLESGLNTKINSKCKSITNVKLTPEQESELKFIIEHNRLFFNKNEMSDNYSQKLEDILREFYIETIENKK